jgi:hypothetical protein
MALSTWLLSEEESLRMMFWGSVSFFAAYLIATHGVSVGFVALPLAITAVGQAAASFCVGYVVKNRHRRRSSLGRL